MARMCSASAGYEAFERSVSRDMQTYGDTLTNEGMLAHHSIKFVPDEVDKSGQLVQPVFKAASACNPMTQRMEYFLGVGLQPYISEAELVSRRHPLCVVFVVDVSGSMAQAYDFLSDGGRTKLQAAKQLVNFIAKDLLRPEDNYSVVTYRSSHDSKEAHDGSTVTLDSLASVEGFGGGDLEAAMDLAQKEMGALQKKAQSSWGTDNKVSTRYIVITDQELRPETVPRRSLLVHDDHSYEEVERKTAAATIPSFLSRVRGEAAKDAFTVVFGVGLDIVTAEHWRQELRGIKGCNFSEMSGDTVQYLQALKKEFAAMVTPIATDFSMELHAAPFTPGGVVGWRPPAQTKMHAREGEFLRFTTIFPMVDAAQGGVFMLKLDPLDFGKASKDGIVGTDTTIAWQYRDINGEQQHCSRTLRFTKLFPSTEKFKMSESIIMDASMRKAVLVTRFVMFVHSTCRCGYWAKQDLHKFERFWEEECDRLKDLSDPQAESFKKDLQLLKKFVNHGEAVPWCALM